MNCLEFESQIDSLARGALLDARTRHEADAHEESCAACAARLADERALSGGLRALASGMKGAEAPARVEPALLAAFRARAAAAELSEAGAASNVVPLAGHAGARQWSWVKTAAVASMAAAASLALFVLVRPGAGTNAPVASREGAGGGQQTAMIEPPPGVVGGRPLAPEVSGLKQPGGVEVASLPSTPDAGTGRVQRAAHGLRAARAVNASYNAGGNRGALAARPAAESRAQEVATDFIPLVQAGPYAQAEEGHLVRVELPRSALASFGLTVGAETASGRVKADVILGEDGIARAIRFVR